VDLILAQIERALERNCHFLAVMSTLTLPDVCAALSSPDGRSTPDSYKRWYAQWVGAKYPAISPQDMYMLRCGVVHQGTLGPPDMQYNRVAFMILPTFHCCLSVQERDGVTDSVFQVHAGTFCHDVMESVREWFATAKDDQTVKANLPRLLQFRANGLYPHFVGIPLIA